MARLERERNSLQDQRDFCMGEIERLRKERDEARNIARWLYLHNLCANFCDAKLDTLFDIEKLRQHAKQFGLREHLTTPAQ